MLKCVLFFIVLATTLAFHFKQPTCSSCSADKDELGRGTWKLLHSMAEHIEPSKNNVDNFHAFLDLLAELYPCSECRVHLKQNLALNRPMLDPVSMCEFHNVINEQLGKPLFKCDF